MSNDHKEDPLAVAALSIPDPAGPWQPKAVRNDWSASGSDQSGYARATVQDGRVASTEGGKALRISTQEIAAAQNAERGVPWEYARDPRTGNRIGPNAVTNDSIIFINDHEVTLAQAREMGWVGREEPAQHPFEQAPQAHTERLPQNAMEDNTDLNAEPFADEAIERNYSALLQNTGGVEQMEAVQQIVSNGEISERTLGTLASQAGIEPSQLQDHLAPIMKAAEAQARKVMSEGGLDADAVIAYAHEHQPDMLQRAMHKHAAGRQTSGYAELRQSYLESLGELNPSAALAADLGPGVTSYLDRGRVVVRLPDGATMLWRQAIGAFAGRKV